MREIEGECPRLDSIEGAGLFRKRSGPCRGGGGRGGERQGGRSSLEAQ